MKAHNRVIHNLEAASKGYANRASKALMNYQQIIINSPERTLSERQIKGIVNDIVKASARLSVSKLMRANMLDN